MSSLKRNGQKDCITGTDLSVFYWFRANCSSLLSVCQYLTVPPSGPLLSNIKLSLLLERKKNSVSSANHIKGKEHTLHPEE